MGRWTTSGSLNIGRRNGSGAQFPHFLTAEGRPISHFPLPTLKAEGWQKRQKSKLFIIIYFKKSKFFLVRILFFGCLSLYNYLNINDLLFFIGEIIFYFKVFEN